MQILLKRTLYTLCFFMLLQGCVSVSDNKSSYLPFKTENTGVSLSTRSGAIWLPITWEISIDKASSDENPIVQIKKVACVIHKKSKLLAKRNLLFTSQTVGEQVLSSTKPSLTMVLPALLSLPEDEYVFENLIVEYALKNTTAVFTATISASDIFADSNPAFSTKNGFLSVFPRINIKTQLPLVKEKMAINQIKISDPEALSGDLSIKNLEPESDSLDLIRAALEDYPILRFSLGTEGLFNEDLLQKRRLVKVGIIFDIPCTLSGKYKLIWKRSRDEKEYYSIISFNHESTATCTDTRSVPHTMLFPSGNWNLLATQYIKSSTSDNITFGTTRSGEHDIKRKISFEISPETVFSGLYSYNKSNINNSNTILYLGRFLLSPSTNDTQEQLSVSTIWDRRFRLSELKQLFSKDIILNAYNLNPLIRDQTKDQIQTHLRVMSENLSKITVQTTEIRKKASEIFAQCILDREQIDPLISVDGKLSFTALKGTTYIDLTSIDIQSDTGSRNWMKECIEKKISSFRFLIKLSSSMHGNIDFILE